MVAQNESVRMNAAIGNVQCDGSACPWKHYETLPDGNMNNVSLYEYKQLIGETMAQNT